MRKLLAANWKMHLTLEQALALTQNLLNGYERLSLAPLPVALFTPAPYLLPTAQAAAGAFAIGAQNLHQEEKGAFTGETSAEMIQSCGGSMVLIGHSERRQYFHETNALLAAKLRRALSAGLKPVFCIGETLAEQEAGQTEAVIEKQLAEGCFAEADFSGIALAYEPVWAIGTGKTATPEYAQNVHAFIRAQLEKRYGAAVAQTTPLLYGGSVKAANAAELFAQSDIDGGLIGGASLNAEEFLAIAQALALAGNTFA